MEISQDDLFLLKKAFLKEKGLVKQHLDSYNKFVDSGLQGVIDEIGEIDVEVPEAPYKIKLGQAWVIDPQTKISGPYVTEVDGTKHEIYPLEARFR
ncbi:MAG: hypothetical protein ACE5IF_05405, partial [Candidatus Bathyarchaeia archaeon]